MKKPKVNKTQRLAREIVLRLRNQGRGAVQYAPGDEIPFLAIWKPVLEQLRALKPDVIVRVDNTRSAWLKIAPADSLIGEQRTAISQLEERNVFVCVATTEWEFFDWLDTLNPPKKLLLRQRRDED